MSSGLLRIVGRCFIMNNYSELLKDPRWQKKRLEILSLDGWQCRQCNNKKETLHVHHMYYEKGKMPWEYDNSALVTYCWECHEDAKYVRWQRAFQDLNLTEFDLLEIALQIKFRKDKNDELMQEFYKEKGCRSMYFYMWFDAFKSKQEIDEFYTDQRDELREFYKNG